jgi:hypothetical protein
MTSRLSDLTRGFAPLRSSLVLFVVSTTSSKRLGTLLRQSCIVIRATGFYRQNSYPRDLCTPTSSSATSPDTPPSQPMLQKMR